MKTDFKVARWINPPKKYDVTDNSVKIITDPQTDFWQRSYYGFRNDNAPALLIESDENFTLNVKVSFEYQERYDQCGVIIYIDSENWFKASIEHENENLSRLGSVVTNKGYSDWATTDILPRKEMWYRLNRRGPDFLIEASSDGKNYKQMRIFHLHKLGETSEEMGKLNPPAFPEQSISFGLYACSPLESSFTATFEDINVEKCKWREH